jgi:hypothetical protein
MLRFNAMISSSLVAIVAIAGDAKAASPADQERLAAVSSQDAQVTYQIDSSANPEPNAAREIVPAVYVSIVKDASGKWIADSVSLRAMARPSPEHEILRVTRNYALGFGSQGAHLIIAPAYELDVDLTSTNKPPIDQAIFSCASLGRLEAQRARAGRYTICASKFTRVSALATGGMLLLGGPLGAGRYVNFSRAGVADAVLQANVIGLARPLFKEVTDALYAQEVPTTLIKDAARSALQQRLVPALGPNTAQSYATDILDQLVKDTSVEALIGYFSTQLAIDPNALTGSYPIDAVSFTSPRAMAAIEAFKSASPRIPDPAQMTARMTAAFESSPIDRAPLDLDCTKPKTMRRPITGNLGGWGTMEMYLHCQPFALWPKAASSAPAAPNAATRLPAIWPEPISVVGIVMAKTMVGFQVEDATLQLRVENGNTTLFNRSDSFVSIRNISLYVGEAVVSADIAPNAPLSLPPRGHVKLEEGLASYREGSLGRALSWYRISPIVPPQGGWQPGSPVATSMGWAIQYDIGGTPQTLVKITKFSLTGQPLPPDPPVAAAPARAVPRRR